MSIVTCDKFRLFWGFWIHFAYQKCQQFVKNPGLPIDSGISDHAVYWLSQRNFKQKKQDVSFRKLMLNLTVVLVNHQFELKSYFA